MINFKRLKDIREDNDITQEKIAKVLNVNRSTYSLWKLGVNIISLDYLCIYADYFNTNIDYVLSLTNTKRFKIIYKGLDLKKLGNNMKDIRLKNNLSQENIATILNVIQPAIAKYENGTVCISLENLYKFSKEFNVPLGLLCGKQKWLKLLSTIFVFYKYNSISCYYIYNQVY